MESEPKKARLWRKPAKFWVGSFLFGIPVGIGGYYFGDWFAGGDALDALKVYFGSDAIKPINGVTLGAAAFYIFLCFVSAVLLVVSYFSPKISRSTGVEAQFGDRKKARAAIWRLGLLWAINGTFLSTLAYLDLVKVPASSASIVMGFGVALIVSAIVLTRQAWSLFDELIRKIWVESLALATGIMLAGAMMIQLSMYVGMFDGISLFQGILAYNAIYFVAYMVLTALRAPETFTNPTLEDS